MRYFLCILIVLLVSCGSVPNVAVTQTGNPSRVAVAFSIDKGGSKLTRSIRESDGDSLSSVTIISTRLNVGSIILAGSGNEVELRGNKPYEIDLYLDGGRVVIDSADVVSGEQYDLVSLVLNDETETIRIVGFTNDDSSSTFEFVSNINIIKQIPLMTPLIISESEPNRITIHFDISQWFIDDDGDIIDPHGDDAREDIEEGILESIYGDEDHDDDEEEE